MLETIISKNFKLISKLGISPFYEVFKAIHLKNQTTVAIKIEQRSVSESKIGTQARIMREIQGEDAIADLGLPRIIQLGTEDNFNYLMVDLLGPSLDSLMLSMGGKLQLRFALELARQMIQRVQTIHSRGYVHRDLRPQHFLYGRQKRPSRLFISGLSIAKKYLRSDGKHVGYRDSRLCFAGTARYCSINTQLGVEQSRRDDIEAIFYILIYLVRGYLPWQGVKGLDRKDKFQKIMMVKVTTPLDVLCNDLPLEITQSLQYIRYLEYEDEPNYGMLITKLKNAEEAILGGDLLDE